MPLRKTSGSKGRKQRSTTSRPASLRQTGVKGRRSLAQDKKKVAKLPGKRRSTSGRVYYERRANRSDVNRKRRI